MGKISKMAVQQDEQFGLTPKQRKFVEVYIKVENGAEAYRQAYNAENMSNSSIYVTASRLLDHPKVSEYLAHLKKQRDAKVTLTLESGVERLLAIAAEAQEAGNHSAAVTATTNAMKALGIFVEKTHNINEDMSAAHLQALRQIVDRPNNAKVIEHDDEIDGKKE